MQKHENKPTILLKTLKSVLFNPDTFYVSATIVTAMGVPATGVWILELLTRGYFTEIVDISRVVSTFHWLVDDFERISLHFHVFRRQCSRAKNFDSCSIII